MKSGSLKDYITRHATESRFHACEKSWKCDEVWDRGRGSCQAFARALTGKAGVKQKRFVGCGCRWDDARHEGDLCTRPDLDEGLTIFVNPVEPFERSAYFKYQQKTFRMIEKARAGNTAAQLPGYIVRRLSALLKHRDSRV